MLHINAKTTNASIKWTQNATERRTVKTDPTRRTAVCRTKTQCLRSRTGNYLHLHCYLAWQNRCELPPTAGITTSRDKPAQWLTDCLLCRLREEYVQDVTYRGRSGCRSRGVSLAGQPPCQIYRSRLRSVPHQSQVAGYCCPLCAGWWRVEVISRLMLHVLTCNLFSLCLHNVTNQGSSKSSKVGRDCLKMAQNECGQDKNTVTRLL